MKTMFTRIDVPMTEIWAATVEGFRINVSNTRSNLSNQTFVYEIAADDGFYSDIIAKGFGGDVETAMRRAVVKAQELAHDARPHPLPVALVITDIESDHNWFNLGMKY